MQHVDEGLRGAGGVRRRSSTTIDFYRTLKSHLGYLHGFFSITAKNIKTIENHWLNSDLTSITSHCLMAVNVRKTKETIMI